MKFTVSDIIELLALYANYAQTGKLIAPIHVQDNTGSVNLVIAWDTKNGYVDLVQMTGSTSQDKMGGTA